MEKLNLMKETEWIGGEEEEEGKDKIKSTMTTRIKTKNYKKSINRS